MEKIGIIGCGWLGQPLAAALVEQGFTVVGSVTTDEKKAKLAAQGVQAVRLKLTPAPEGELAALLAADALVISVPPRAGAFGDAFHPQQIRHLTDAIRQTRRSPYVIYVSSTSVYPENNREAVEADVVTVQQAAAPALVEAEQLVLALGNASVVRCGGLMGYDRRPGKYVAGKKDIPTGAVPVNYIHRDDAAGILRALLAQPQPGEVFNAVAPRHPTRAEVYRESCQRFGYEQPTFAEPAAPVPFKIVDAGKVGRVLGYQFRHPDPLTFP